MMPYPNVAADYTVVPGVTMPTDTMVTLTGSGLPMIDIDTEGNVRGVLASPQFAADSDRSWLVALAAIATSAFLSAAVAGLAFHVYGKRKTALAPAVAVGASTAVLGVLMYALNRD